MRFHSVCILAAAAILSLTACGGGGSLGSRPAPAPGDIRELTGLSAPAETGAAQQQRRPGIFSRADSLVISTMHVEAALPDGNLAFRLVSECSGSQCELLDPVSGETEAISLGTVAFVPGDAETIGSAHGITLMSESGRHMDVDKTSFGAWMEHGAFTFETDRSISEGAGIIAAYALALGDLTARPLNGTAAWAGVQVVEQFGRPDEPVALIFPGDGRSHHDAGPRGRRRGR